MRPLTTTLQSLDCSGGSGISNLGLGLGCLGIERNVQAQTLTSGVGSDTPVSISFSNELLATGVNKQTNEIRAHVMTRKVSQRLGQVAFVEVDLRSMLVQQQGRSEWV